MVNHAVVISALLPLLTTVLIEYLENNIWSFSQQIIIKYTNVGL